MDGAFYYWYAVVPRKFSGTGPLLASKSSFPPLSAEATDDLSAIVSPWPAPHVNCDPTLVWQHAEIIEHLGDLTAHQVLPFRFGTVVTGDELKTMMARHYDAWTKALKRLSGRMEMSLRVLWSPPLPSTPLAPLASPYLAKRMQERAYDQTAQEKAEPILQTIDQYLSPYYVDKSEKILQPPTVLLHGAYLVEKHEAPRFRHTIKAMMDEFTAMKWLCTGPWSPYHFVTEGRVP